MTDRRTFMKRAAGVFFCPCGLSAAAHAQTPRPPRAPVVIAGQRARTIDTHAHCYFRESLTLMGADWEKIMPPVKGVPQHFISQKEVLDQRFAAMEAMGVDMQVLNTNPFWYGAPRELADSVCKAQNEKLAEICAAHPKQFAGFASLPMQAPDLAVQHLETAVKKLGLKGAAVGGSVLGVDFAEEKFHPVWAKAEELGAVIFIHPQSVGELATRLRGNGWMSNVIGNPLETTIALQKLIYQGVLDKYPGLKILAAHGGGYLPSYAPRSDHSCFVSPQNCDAKITLKKKPSEYLNQLHFDALVFTAEGLRHLVAQVGASQVVLGTDHPIPWEENPVDHVMGTTSLSDADRIAILGGNAGRLLGITA